MIFVPPIKCQGIKTKLIPAIRASLPDTADGLWVEPFCGSGVVALNVQPKRAVLSDKNRHIIQLYRDIQQEIITPSSVRRHLDLAGEHLRRHGQTYYNEVRTRFNEQGHSLDFLFLNRACFNGVMRFNQRGKFNVPFGHKPDRFRPAYITKIVNQVRKFYAIVSQLEWRFEALDFRDALALADSASLIYADPPYLGRHTDYFNRWSEADEHDLIRLLKTTDAAFLLSTWHHNQHRTNPMISTQWGEERFEMRLVEHFYHVGSTESLRGEMTEALIANYPLRAWVTSQPSEQQLRLL